MTAPIRVITDGVTVSAITINETTYSPEALARLTAHNASMAAALDAIARGGVMSPNQLASNVLNGMSLAEALAADQQDTLTEAQAAEAQTASRRYEAQRQLTAAVMTWLETEEVARALRVRGAMVAVVIAAMHGGEVTP